MRPLVAIGLVFLATIAWTGTVLTLLIALAQARLRRRAETLRADQATEARTSDLEAAKP
jgi:hypothetical protein